MSVSELQVTGFHAPDEKFEKMKKVWDACVDIDVTIPDEVYHFFKGSEPAEEGMLVGLDNHECVSDASEDLTEGVCIDLSKLPANITHIKVKKHY
jgi:hypothetical protein